MKRPGEGREYIVVTIFFSVYKTAYIYIKKRLMFGCADGFTGIYSCQLSPQCWSADSQRVIISCPQRSLKVKLLSGKFLDIVRGKNTH